MQAYKTTVTIQDPDKLVLTGLPFRKGEQVEIVVLGSAAATATADSWRALLAETQALPQIQTLTDEDIAAEIAAYRTQQ